MNQFPCLIGSSTPGGEARFVLGDPLVDSYLAFVAGRCRPNTLRAVAHDLKTFFSVVDECLSPEGLNLIQSNRPAGWQDGFHFHLHVVPRWFGDRLTPPWRPGHSPEEVLADTATRLRSKGQECP
jgi:diadenosine tetraphosphate (Ap4A) HIT family hydrolase